MVCRWAEPRAQHLPAGMCHRQASSRGRVSIHGDVGPAVTSVLPQHRPWRGRTWDHEGQSKAPPPGLGWDATAHGATWSQTSLVREGPGDTPQSGLRSDCPHRSSRDNGQLLDNGGAVTTTARKPSSSPATTVPGATGAVASPPPVPPCLQEEAGAGISAPSVDAPQPRHPARGKVGTGQQPPGLGPGDSCH